MAMSFLFFFGMIPRCFLRLGGGNLLLAFSFFLVAWRCEGKDEKDI
jgi:hypothetical protein